MALKTVTGKLTNASTGLGGVVYITLSQAAVITGTQEVVPSTIPVVVDPTLGTYTVQLQATNDLTPNGTYYTVQEIVGESEYSFTIQVPQTAGPFVMSNLLTSVPTASPSPNHVSTLTVDGAAKFGGPDPWLDVTHPTYGAVGDDVNDDTAAFTALVNSLNATPGRGWIPAPAVAYRINGEIPTLTNYRSVLLGAGAAIVTIDYRGSGRCFQVQEVPFVNHPTSPGTTPGNTGPIFGGVTIDGSNAGAGAAGLIYGDVVGGICPDLGIQHFNKAGSIGLSMVNATNWTERTTFPKLRLLDNTITVQFTKTGGGTSSFEHTHMDAEVEINNTQVGFQMDSTGTQLLLYRSIINVRANVGGTATLFKINGKSSFIDNQVFIVADDASAGTATFIAVDDAGGAIWRTFGVLQPGAANTMAITGTVHGTHWGLTAPNNGTVPMTGLQAATKPSGTTYDTFAIWDSVNNNYKFLRNSNGTLQFLNNAFSANIAQLTDTGVFSTSLQLRPGDEAGGIQSTGFLHSTGTPNNAHGATNDWVISDLGIGSLFFKSGGSWIQKFKPPTVTYITTTGASTYTTPVGATSIFVEAWGGGGGGSSVAASVSGGGGGGGGGAYAAKTFLAPAGSYTVTVAAAANGGAAGAANAGTGGNTTTFDTGGASNPNAAGGGGGPVTGGGGGTGGVPSAGDVQMGGGGGGSGGGFGSGMGGSAAMGGGGGKGVPLVSGTAGINGGNYGGGGSGAGTTAAGGSAAGGNGAQGLIKVTEYY